MTIIFGIFDGATTMHDYRQKSFWLSQLDLTPGPPLQGERRCDVAIIGGGFTGISTAYFLKQIDPSLEIILLERDLVGYGASGRNAGFSMKLFGFTLAMTALRFGRDNAIAAHHYMTEAVSLVQELITRHQIDCDYEHTGFMRLATSRAYEKRIKKEIDFAHRCGIDDITWLDADTVHDKVRSPLFLGAAWEPHSAILNPAKLIRGMKTVVEELGVQIFEQSAVESISPGTPGSPTTVHTAQGTIHTGKLVLATNAYSHLLPLVRQKQAPAFTHIILTEPLTERHFRAIGWHERQGLEDARNMIHYFRLTADNRILIGGSDVQVPFGTNMDLDRSPPTFQTLERDLKTLFPALADLAITHRWGGPVSITVDMAPAIGFAATPDIVYSIGCIGHGVSLTHLNGKTIAELLLDQKTDRTEMFFVNRKVLPWPHEPLRFAASQAFRHALRLQDKLLDPRP